MNWDFVIGASAFLMAFVGLICFMTAIEEGFCGEDDLPVAVRGALGVALMVAAIFMAGLVIP